MNRESSSARHLLLLVLLSTATLPATGHFFRPPRSVLGRGNSVGDQSVYIEHGMASIISAFFKAPVGILTRHVFPTEGCYSGPPVPSPSASS